MGCVVFTLFLLASLNVNVVLSQAALRPQQSSGGTGWGSQYPFIRTISEFLGLSDQESSRPSKLASRRNSLRPATTRGEMLPPVLYFPERMDVPDSTFGFFPPPAPPVDTSYQPKPTRKMMPKKYRSQNNQKKDRSIRKLRNTYLQRNDVSDNIHDFTNHYPEFATLNPYIRPSIHPNVRMFSELNRPLYSHINMQPPPYLATNQHFPGFIENTRLPLLKVHENTRLPLLKVHENTRLPLIKEYEIDNTRLPLLKVFENPNNRLQFGEMIKTPSNNIQPPEPSNYLDLDELFSNIPKKSSLLYPSLNVETTLKNSTIKMLTNNVRRKKHAIPMNKKAYETNSKSYPNRKSFGSPKEKSFFNSPNEKSFKVKRKIHNSAPRPQRLHAQPPRRSASFLASPKEGSMAADAFQPLFKASPSLDKKLPDQVMKPMSMARARALTFTPTAPPPQIHDFFQGHEISYDAREPMYDI